MPKESKATNIEYAEMQVVHYEQEMARLKNARSDAIAQSMEWRKRADDMIHREVVADPAIELHYTGNMLTARYLQGNAKYELFIAARADFSKPNEFGGWIWKIDLYPDPASRYSRRVAGSVKPSEDRGLVLRECLKYFYQSIYKVSD